MNIHDESRQSASELWDRLTRNSKHDEGIRTEYGDMHAEISYCDIHKQYEAILFMGDEIGGLVPLENSDDVFAVLLTLAVLQTGLDGIHKLALERMRDRLVRDN